MSGLALVFPGQGSQQVGMGRAIARGLADEGCRVVAVGRTATKLQETIAGYSGNGRIISRTADVASREQVTELLVVHQEIPPLHVGQLMQKHTWPN